ncbi:PxKF domain-containing protein [Paenibacillus sp. GCM10023250]|uniref:glucuronyl esterase domain-containing protein n=1 Tax=Paenibacillus sp. GCM10023250 TaxID=3252648 RepID=UPI00361E86E9
MRMGLRGALTAMLGLALLPGIAAPAATAAPGDRYPYDQRDDKNFVSNTSVLERFSPDGGDNRSYKVNTPRAQASARFTAGPIAVDAVKEAAWDEADAYPIGNKFNPAMTAAAPGATAEGTLRLLWDGPMLYGLVEVTGDTSASDAGTPNWNTASYAPNMDGLFVNMDVFNDKWGLETDTQGVFFLGANPNAASAASFNNAGIPSLGSFFNPNNQDYSPRLAAFKASGYDAATNSPGVNYTYEFALQMEGWGDDWDRPLVNGTQVGLEVAIYDQNHSFTYWSKTDYNAGREGNSNLPNSERVRNRDWGEVTLAGWDGLTPFAYSGWRADEDIRFWNSKSNPGGSGNGTAGTGDGDGSLVWTAASKDRMVSAKAAYLAVKDNPDATRVEKEAAVLAVCQAFAGLRWADTKYPDPHDLPVVNTLPSVWEFFDKSKGTNGMVTSEAEWAERKQEILDLAQFYEYGYKPQLGVDYTVSVVANDYGGTGNATVTAKVTPTNVNFAGGVEQTVPISITMPAAGVPSGQAAPISFGGSWTGNGIANIAFPVANWARDGMRTDAAAWGTPNRAGTFYALFPYSRNSTVDVSMEMANAASVSIYLDILEHAAAANPALAAKIDPSRAVTKGFSINGKLAFLAGVFDERVKAVVAGGAGATGPANWRYNAQGQAYNFKDTPFSGGNPGAEQIVAHGTEGPGNSYRHNRTRETELFRHFLPYGHMYKHEDGSYGYGSFGRLPFDQTSLVATLAPDRAIIIDTNLNDYNDGAATDNMSLSVAKSVWNALGVSGDDYVKFNTGNYVASGDPHGAASPVVEGKYLHDWFYGTRTLTEDEADRLNTDPYALRVSNGQTQSPYDYYWGGYNTITGGQDGISGTDGWYYYEFPGNPVFDILPPVRSDGSGVFKQGSTVPVKFRLTDRTGAAIAGVKAVLTIAEIKNGKAGEEQAAVSTSGAVSGNAFRYDGHEGLYIFNLSTKPLHEGTYRLTIQYVTDPNSKAVRKESVIVRLR